MLEEHENIYGKILHEASTLGRGKYIRLSIEGRCTLELINAGYLLGTKYEPPNIPFEIPFYGITIEGREYLSKLRLKHEESQNAVAPTKPNRIKKAAWWTGKKILIAIFGAIGIIATLIVGSYYESHIKPLLPFLRNSKVGENHGQQHQERTCNHSGEKE